MTELPAVTLLRRRSWTSDDGRPFSWDEFQVRDDAGPCAGRRWCQVLVWNDEHEVSGYGGEVSPATWPALFRVLGPAGERRFLLTEAGALLLSAARIAYATRPVPGEDAPSPVLARDDTDPREVLRRPDVLDAVRSAAYHSETGPLSRHHDALVRLLRVADPADETLALLDRRDAPDDAPDARLGEEDERVLASMLRAMLDVASARATASAIDAARKTAHDARVPLDDRHLWTLVRCVRSTARYLIQRQALTSLVAATRGRRRGRRLRSSTAWRVRVRGELGALAERLATLDEDGTSAVRRGLAWVDASGELPADLAWRRSVGRLEALATRYGGVASPVAGVLRELVEAVDVAAADHELLLLEDEDEAARSLLQEWERADTTAGEVSTRPGAGAR